MLVVDETAVVVVDSARVGPVVAGTVAGRVPVVVVLFGAVVVVVACVVVVVELAVVEVAAAVVVVAGAVVVVKIGGTVMVVVRIGGTVMVVVRIGGTVIVVVKIGGTVVSIGGSVGRICAIGPCTVLAELGVAPPTSVSRKPHAEIALTKSAYRSGRDGCCIWLYRRIWPQT